MRAESTASSADTNAVGAAPRCIASMMLLAVAIAALGLVANNPVLASSPAFDNGLSLGSSTGYLLSRRDRAGGTWRLARGRGHHVAAGHSEGSGILVGRLEDADRALGDLLCPAT